MTQRERLNQFIDYIGYSVRSFEREIGVSNGTIRHLRDNLSANVKQRVSAKFPQLNQTWLLTGNGEMLVSGECNGDSIHHNTGNVATRGAHITTSTDDKDRLIASLQSQITTLQAQIDTQHEHADLLQSQIATLQSQIAELKADKQNLMQLLTNLTQNK